MSPANRHQSPAKIAIMIVKLGLIMIIVVGIFILSIAYFAVISHGLRRIMGWKLT